VEVVLEHLDVFARATRTTAELALASFAGALVIGVITAAFRVSPVAPLRVAGTFYVETIRNIPPLVLLVVFFFGFPKIGIIYSPFVSAILVMAVYTGSFIGEAVRSGINTVARGQAEAARAIGLTFAQSLSLVILPQALRAVVPLASVISVHELAWTSEELIRDTGRPFEILGGTAVAYLLMTLPTGYGLAVLERRTAIKR
jgi:glutamate transport system permease protein